MEEKKQQILEFIKRSLILSKTVKEKVQSELDGLSESQLGKLFFVMGKIDEKQTSILEQKLQKEPWFFMKLQTIISKESYRTHLAEEFEELKQLEFKFDQMLEGMEV